MQQEARRPVPEGGAQMPRGQQEAAGLGEGRSWVPTVLMNAEPGFHKLAYKASVYPDIEQFPTQGDTQQKSAPVLTVNYL